MSLVKFLSDDLISTAENIVSNRINEVIRDVGDTIENDSHTYITENIQNRLETTLRNFAFGELNTFVFRFKNFIFENTLRKIPFLPRIQQVNESALLQEVKQTGWSTVASDISSVELKEQLPRNVVENTEALDNANFTGEPFGGGTRSNSIDTVDGSFPTYQDFLNELADVSEQKFLTPYENVAYKLDISFNNENDVSPYNNSLDTLIESFKGKIISLLIQTIELPGITSDPEEMIETLKGFASFSGMTNKPESNSFTIGFIMGEYSIFENLFLEWMKQATSDVYHYDDFPFKKATITIQFLDMYRKDVIMKYSFEGAFPSRMDPPTLSQETPEIQIRNVEFLFNRLKIETINNS